MSEYNRNRVIDFLIKHRKFISSLKKFQQYTQFDDNKFVDAIINSIKFNDQTVKLLKQFFLIKKIQTTTLFCTAVAEINHANKLKRNIEYFPEITTDNTHKIKGTIWFTSCDTKETKRNLSSKFNLSLNTTFLGNYDSDLGRLLFYRNNVTLNMIYTGDTSFQGRRLLSNMLTKLILGQDYNLEKMDNDFNGYGSNALLVDVNQDNDAVCGLWSGYGTLPEYVINYLFEILWYDYRSYGISDDDRIDGIIALDGSYDSLLKIKVFGTEYRIFNAEKLMTLESVLYMDKMYYNINQYKEKIENDKKNYGTSKISKKWSLHEFQSTLSKMNDYCVIRNNDASMKQNNFNASTKNFVQVGGYKYDMFHSRKMYLINKENYINIK